GDQLFGVAAGERAVVGVRADVEQYMAFGRVRVAAGDQRLVHGDDRADVRGGVRLQVWRRNAQPGHVLAIGARVALGDDRDRHAFGQCRGIDLVLDVGDVT